MDQISASSSPQVSMHMVLAEEVGIRVSDRYQDIHN